MILYRRELLSCLTFSVNDNECPVEQIVYLQYAEVSYTEEGFGPTNF